MTAKTQDLLVYGALGAAAGGGLALLVWFVASRQLDRQFDAAAAQMLTRGSDELRREIRKTLDQEIPARVGREIDTKMREVGITRDTGRQLAALLELADRTGLIGLRP